MPMEKFLSSLYVLLISPLLLSCQEANYPVAGEVPVKNTTIVEDHSEFLIDWMQKGYKDMILVHIDEHDDFRYIPEYKMRQLKSLYREKKWAEIDNQRDKAHGLFSIADFLYPAYKLGIIKKYYWVPTTDRILSDKIQKNMREFIESWDYSDEIVRPFSTDGHTIAGNIYGLDIEISSIQDLPEIKEPVLLSIDLDYFADVIEETKTEELQVIMDFFSTLRKKRIKIKDVNIAYSTNGSHTPITDRHLCEEIIYFLEHPEIMSNHTIPPLWNMRNEGFHLIRSNKPEDALQFFNKSLSQYNNEPTLLLGKAISLTLTDDHTYVMNTISRLLQTDPDYDYVFIYLREVLKEKGNTSLAQYYFSEYFKRNPDYYSWMYNNK
jgi:tetratricopeptide (TPR) repeat protein